jgi:3-hydroxyisobutyrate dehydrogenase
MPVTSAAREVLQSHIGALRLKPDAERYLAADFAALLETLATASGMRLKSEQKAVPTGLED